ncbi:MAG: ATP-binding protein [Thermoguttaceae bacterium]|jgi:two-component system phosphate regulon sensor histidine kinase PhoR
MRRRRLFWQLYPATLLIALVALAVVALDASSSLRQFYIARTAEDLESRARLAEDQIVPLLAGKKYDEIDALCKELGKRTSTRLTVILSNGKVVGDSLESPKEMDNHATRSEVADALEEAKGVSLRYSQTLHQTLCYVAVPARDHGQTLGVVRAAVSLKAIDNALGEIRSHILLVSVMTAVLLAVTSLIIARRFVKPLEQLSHHAEWFARGDLGHRLSTASSEEIDGLAETLNKMAADLKDKLDTVVRQRNERDAILSSMVEGVMAIDTDERLLRMNDAAARLLGVDIARAEGRSLPEVVRSIDLHKLVATVISTQQPVEGEVVLRDREARFLHVHGTVLRDTPEGRSGALLVIHDVTDRKRLESIRRDFVANVSHELKTPVTSIQGYVETLLDGAMNDGEQREKFLKIVAKHTERLHAILEDLLTLARVEQEGEKPQNVLANESLRNVLEAAIADCGAKAEEKNMQIQLACPAELTVSMNASLLEQAVVNLIENAIAYSPPGQTIDVSGLAGEREIEIRVRDHGCGISREHLPRIFERFYRVDKSRSRASGGTGLGLAIVKHIVQIHGGRTAVESILTQGSTFSIFLPK